MFALVSRIKKIIVAIISLCFCIFLMLVISFYGEKQYQQHCEELGLKCEKGQIHQLKDSFVTWANKKFQDIKKNNTFE